MTTVKQVNLVDVGNADHGKSSIDGNRGASFLMRLPACGRTALLAVRNRQVVSKSRGVVRNGAPAQKNLSVPFGNTANDHAGFS